MGYQAIWGRIAPLLLLSSILAMPPGARAAQADDSAAIAGYFGATLTIDIPDMYSAKRYFAPDHSYTETGDDGDVHGTWSIKNGKVCTIQSAEHLDRPREYCNLGLGRKPGETWLDKDPVTGNQITFALIAGRDGAAN